MTQSYGKMFVRLSVALVTAMIFLIFAVVPARRFFLDDQVLTHQFQFQVISSSPEAPALWEKFAVRQQQVLLSLARDEMPLLADNFTACHHGHTPVIYLELRCRANYEVTDSFRAIINQYIAEYQAERKKILSQAAPPAARLDLSVRNFGRVFRFSPGQYIFLALAGLAGGAVGLFLANFAGSFRSHEGKPSLKDAGSFTQAPSGMSTAPAKAPSAEKPTLSSQQEEEKTTLPCSAPLISIDLNHDHPDDQSSLPDSSWHPKYDHLAGLVEQLGQNLSRSAVVLISAVKPADASVRFVVNLAITMTRRQLRVLLIETDPDNGDLARLFELPPEAGFYEWRRGQAWTGQTAHETQLPNLFFMPAGTPSEEQKKPHLDLSKESHRWANLRRSYDLILLHSPIALSTAGAAADDAAPADAGAVAGDAAPAAQLLDLADGIFALARPTKAVGLLKVHKSPTLPSLSKIAAILTGHTAQLLGLIQIEG